MAKAWDSKAMWSLLVVAALFAGFAPSTTAASADTTRAPYPYSAFTSSGCGFEIDVAFPAQNQFQTTRQAPDGSTINEITGYLEAAFTNASKGGPTVTENVSGSTMIVTHPDGSQVYTYTGPTFLAFSARLAARLGVPPVFVLEGTAVLTVPSGGPPSSISHTGTITDMCALLA